jgi:hypothetical protein
MKFWIQICWTCRYRSLNSSENLEVTTVGLLVQFGVFSAVLRLANGVNDGKITALSGLWLREGQMDITDDLRFLADIRSTQAEPSTCHEL